MKTHSALFVMTTVSLALTACSDVGYLPSKAITAEPPYQAESEAIAAKALLVGGATAQDWRQHKTNGMCYVHDFQMKTIYVPGLSGEVLFPDSFHKAQEKYFPHAGIVYPKDLYSDEVGKIFVCPKCISARKAWGNKSG